MRGPAPHPRPSTRGLAVYRFLTGLLSPLVPLYLRRRAKRGKEVPARMGERLGHASLARPGGALVWVHAASVGESLSVLPLIERLMAERPGLHVLVTTGTVTSARLLENRLPAGALHQFAPVDTPDATDRFLDHWRPDAVLLVESELWPNLICEVASRGIFLALVSARMSPSSVRGWRWWTAAARALTGAIAICLAQDETTATRLKLLGAPNVRNAGNLKVDAPPPPASPELLAELNGLFAGRPAWLASSTHPGEERLVAEAHTLLKQLIPGILTVIAPRHAERGDAIAAELRESGLTVAQRTKGGTVAPDTDIYLADTLGELGGFYRVLTIVFMAGSFSQAGGHNPIEPALLGGALMHGPRVHNWLEIYRVFEMNGASEKVTDAQSLAAAVARLMSDGTLAGARLTAAAKTAASLTGALDRTLEALSPYLDAHLPKSAEAEEGTRAGGHAGA